MRSEIKDEQTDKWKIEIKTKIESEMFFKTMNEGKKGTIYQNLFVDIVTNG